MIYEGLRLLLGVTGSIAAYRALDIASNIIKGGGQVRAVLTPHAAKLVSPTAFEAITGRPAVVSLWSSDHPGEMDHLAATKWANVFCVAPATAGTIARLAHGMADDALSTFAVAWPEALIICPAMNPTMFKHPTVGENLARLRARGAIVIGPGEGPTACGDQGIGRLVDVEQILIAIVDLYRARRGPELLPGRRVLVTSGPTREFADPVRCITNPSTGRMGLAIARAAMEAGARVALVSGPCELPMPEGLESLDRVTTAEQMRDAVLRRLPTADVAVFAAAVSDWRPAEMAPRKAKKEAAAEEVTLRLVRTPDIAAEAAAARRPGQFLVGFAAETEDLEANARDKMRRKGFDLVAANLVNESGSGFGTETNKLLLVGPRGSRELPLASKDEAARALVAEIAKAMTPSLAH